MAVGASIEETSPVAPSFIVSAPGKTIVYGEHAVVHGRAAIAAAISLRSYLFVTTLSASTRTVTLKFSDIGLDYTWILDDLPWAAFKDKAPGVRSDDRIDSLDQVLVDAMHPHIQNVGSEAEPHTRKIHQAAANAFLYQFLCMSSDQRAGAIYALRSTIPIGAGLGSSASISVCIATALLLQAGALVGPSSDQSSKEAEEQLERINRWAFVGELLIHGNPSGVDNTVATNGNAVLFQRTGAGKPPSVNVLRNFPELPLLVIDTCQPKSTAAEVAKVGALLKKHTIVTNQVMDAIDNLVRSAHDHITNHDPASEETLTHLGELMTLNHGLLSTLGVSHPRLERLRHLVAESEVGWVKLTGSGGGGCAIALLKSDAANSTPSPAMDADLNGTPALPAHSQLQKLERQLDGEGYKRYTTTLGGDGAGVLSPAVLHGRELSVESFLAAAGRDEVEHLVGGKGVIGEGEGWMYWRP